MPNKPINELITLLSSAIKIANDNIQNADNFDLEDLSQVLESYVDDLKEIGNFKQFDYAKEAGSDEDVIGDKELEATEDMDWDQLINFFKS